MRPSWIGFDSCSVITWSCYFTILLLEDVLEYSVCILLELLVIYSQIIEKTHGWVIISTVMHVDREFWKSDAINLGYFIFYGQIYLMKQIKLEPE